MCIALVDHQPSVGTISIPAAPKISARRPDQPQHMNEIAGFYRLLIISTGARHVELRGL